MVTPALMLIYGGARAAEVIEQHKSGFWKPPKERSPRSATGEASGSERKGGPGGKAGKGSGKGRGAANGQAADLELESWTESSRTRVLEDSSPRGLIPRVLEDWLSSSDRVSQGNEHASRAEAGDTPPATGAGTKSGVQSKAAQSTDFIPVPAAPYSGKESKEPLLNKDFSPDPEAAKVVVSVWGDTD